MLCVLGGKLSAGLVGRVVGRRGLAVVARVVATVVRSVSRSGRLAAQIGGVRRVVVSRWLAMFVGVVMSVVGRRRLARLAMMAGVVMSVIRRRRLAMLAGIVVSAVRAIRPARDIRWPHRRYGNGNSRGTGAAALRTVLSRDLEARRRVVCVACRVMSGSLGGGDVGGDCGGDGGSDGGVARGADVDVGGLVGGGALVVGWGGAGERCGAGDARRHS